MKRTICFILVFMFIISAVSVFAVESNDTDVENTIDEETQISEQLLTDERAAQLINALVYIKENLNDKEYKKALTYIGYTEDELQDRDDFQEDKILWLQQYKNIVIKFGRFIPNQEHHFDEVLGVELASPNQYARRIS